MNVELTVVVPVLDEEQSLPEMLRRLVVALEGCARSFEVLFVDDGSRDGSWALIADAARRDPRVRGLRFSRNFGHEVAVTAGLDDARGEAAVIIDADLQDPPEVIGELVARWREGHDVVYAVRSARTGESAFKRLTAAAFYRVLRALTRVDIPVDTGDFRLLGPRALAAYRRLEERHRFTRGLVAWLGFDQVGVPFERAARHAGETKYSLRAMWRLAVDGVTAFSAVALQVAAWLGGLVTMGGIVGMIVAAVAAIAGRAPGTGVWLLLVLLTLVGLQFVALGVLGAYVGRIADEVRRRPLYLVRERAETSTPAGLVRA